MDIKNEPINVFEGLKNEMSDGGSSRSFDDAWKLIKDRQLEGKHIDETQRLVYEMQYLIYKKRYDNLGCFLEGLKTSRFNKYKEELIINEAVKDMLFFDNPLNEFNYIGTDLYANSMFIQSKVPYLYRCVGKDGDKNPDEEEESGDSKNTVIRIFEHVLSQIENNNSDDSRKAAKNMYSYSKCFGLSLYKYANLLNQNNSVTFEVRENALLNSVFHNGNVKSLHEFAKICSDGGSSISKLPFFCVDMSNARDNDVNNLKNWITNDMKIKREWAKYYKDIVDPIGDAEVVCNFTGSADRIPCDNGILCGSVRRYTITGRDDFCKLLYAYFKTYAIKSGFKESFDSFVKASVDTLQTISYFVKASVDTISYKDYFQEIINNYQSVNDVSDTVSEIVIGNEKISIDWDNEMNYMSRKNKKTGNDKQVQHRDVYNGKKAEPFSATWKEILFGAVEQKYSYYDYTLPQMEASL